MNKQMQIRGQPKKALSKNALKNMKEKNMKKSEARRSNPRKKRVDNKNAAIFSLCFLRCLSICLVVRM